MILGVPTASAESAGVDTWWSVYAGRKSVSPGWRSTVSIWSGREGTRLWRWAGEKEGKRLVAAAEAGLSSRNRLVPWSWRNRLWLVS